MATKKRTRHVPRKLNTPFLKSGLEAINTEIEKHYGFLSGKITPEEAEDCYRKYQGLCVFCDTLMGYLGRPNMASARLMFYVPLRVGGAPTTDNLILVCNQCKEDYRDTRKLRTDITGLDSFADCCEQLFMAVRDGYPQVKINMLKARLNGRLSDIALCMRYITTPDWMPITMTNIVSGENTIGERLEQMGKGEDVKPAITEDVKQIVTTKQYKIMRPTKQL